MFFFARQERGARRRRSLNSIHPLRKPRRQTAPSLSGEQQSEADKGKAADLTEEGPEIIVGKESRNPINNFKFLTRFLEVSPNNGCDKENAWLRSCKPTKESFEPKYTKFKSHNRKEFQGSDD